MRLALALLAVMLFLAAVDMAIEQHRAISVLDANGNVVNPRVASAE